MKLTKDALWLIFNSGHINKELFLIEMDLSTLSFLYRTMFTAREVDAYEMQLVSQNQAHFHVSCSGHEAMAVLASYLHEFDWLHLHYRDKALMLARGMPIEEFFRSLLAKKGSHSTGRQMSAHFSAPGLHICSLVGPVGNNALQAVGIAAAIKGDEKNPIVVCSLGDGSAQQGEFLEAVAEAVRRQLPILFIVEDNRFSISTLTVGQTFFDLPTGKNKEFYGLNICHIDGTDIFSLDSKAKEVIEKIRRGRRPEIVVIHFERLTNHTNADNHASYRNLEEISYIQNYYDPLIKLRRYLLDNHFSNDELCNIETGIRKKISAVIIQVQNEPDPSPQALVSIPYPEALLDCIEYLGEELNPSLTMREAINGVLKFHLSQDQHVFLYGQDIEDPKGDVFGVTKGLSTMFPDRVKNACLSESTIVGTSIGRALTGQRPVAFIQFADFLPLAFNQIMSELGSMYWRTDGNWQCPVIIMATCGAYKPGLGPFHAQTMEGYLTHIPGIDIFMPSTAFDAAGLLNAAFKSKRPTVFLYPKSCLNNLERATSLDVEKQIVIPGNSRKVSHGKDLTLVSWGYPTVICEKVVKLFEENGSAIELFDLRSLSPWDKDAVLASAEKTGRLIVVHEDNLTSGFGAEIVASITESVKRQIQVRRIARPDTYIPFNFDNQLDILPSYKKIAIACAELLDFDLEWLEIGPISNPGEFTIRAIGSGPSDENIELIKLFVSEGDFINEGDRVAEIEATKSVVEICSTVSGKVKKITASIGDMVSVNAPLVIVETGGKTVQALDLVNPEHFEFPKLSKRITIIRPKSEAQHQNNPDSSLVLDSIYLTKPSCVLGGRSVASEELGGNIEGWPDTEIIRRTGIRRRFWRTEEENVVTLAVRSCLKLFSSLDFEMPAISTVICSTTTPCEASPSVACQVANQLQGFAKFSEHYSAFDINAACSGFLYGLRVARDFLQNNSESSVLLITSEVLSPKLNKDDPATVFIFGDAASACLVTNKNFGLKSLKVNTPLLFTIPDPEIAIHLPCYGDQQFLRMDGMAVARMAYKAMVSATKAAMMQSQLHHSDISAIVPHPGSQRILQNVAEHLNFPMSSVKTTLADTGNTSSSSIPLALEYYWDSLPSTGYMVLTAFGAGFTAAAATAQLIKG